MPIGAPLLLLPWGGAGAFPLGAAAVPGRDLAELSTRMDRPGSSPSTATAASSATRGSEELELAVVEYLGWFRPSAQEANQRGLHESRSGSLGIRCIEGSTARRCRTGRARADARRGGLLRRRCAARGRFPR